MGFSVRDSVSSSGDFHFRCANLNGGWGGGGSCILLGMLTGKFAVGHQILTSKNIEYVIFDTSSV